MLVVRRVEQPRGDAPVMLRSWGRLDWVPEKLSCTGWQCLRLAERREAVSRVIADNDGLSGAVLVQDTDDVPSRSKGTTR